MVDIFTKEERSEHMSRIRGRDTRPELIVRRLIHRMGYRYRLHRRDLPGAPDITFAKRKKAIFINGCFWHQHPDPAAGYPEGQNLAWTTGSPNWQATTAVTRLTRPGCVNWAGKCLLCGSVKPPILSM